MGTYHKNGELKAYFNPIATELTANEAKIDTELVAKIIINLRQPGKNRLGMSNFNF